MSAFIEITTRNVLYQEVKVFAGFSWRTRYDWGIKDITKDCENCSHCVGQEEALVLVEIVNLNKGSCQWQPPLAEGILGICLWGVSPKILCQKEKPRKCQYFEGIIKTEGGIVMEAYKIECMKCNDDKKIEVHKTGDNKIIIYCPGCNRVTMIKRCIVF